MMINEYLLVLSGNQEPQKNIKDNRDLSTFLQRI